MKTRWTEQKATTMLSRKGATIEGKRITIERKAEHRKDVFGNGAWSAVDYLTNHCGYYCNL